MSTPTETDVGPHAEGQSPAQEVELAYRDAINAALTDEFEADPAVLLIGEDVANDGGVFKTNHGLRERFGERRIFNTPICENGFVGVALGMAVMGMRPVVEIMFSDFLPTAGDAIVNELPKYRYMSGGRCTVPVTIRSVSGATGRFGTQHSATGESWYMAQPGLRVVTASSPRAAYSLLRAAIQSDDPVIFHEHKGLYGRKGPVRRGEIATIGRSETVRRGADVTLVATMLMVERSLQAAEALAADGVDTEVIDLRWIRPLDIPAIAASVARTGRLVVVEEQVHAGGWGATVISEIAKSGPSLRSPARSVSLPDHLLVPYSPPLEDEILPSPAAIAEVVRGAVRD